MRCPSIRVEEVRVLYREGGSEERSKERKNDGAEKEVVMEQCREELREERGVVMLWSGDGAVKERVER